jgi:spermidine synthase
MVWCNLAEARLTSGETLTLRRSGDDFEIRLDLYQLMSSQNSVSERALAKIVCGRIVPQAARVLIGGLGMGFTARAVLDGTGAEARITIAELVPEVVSWNRAVLGHLAGRPLDDPRVTVAQQDVADVIAANPAAFDAILMDVDNGPDAVLFATNRFLYSVNGVALILSGLRPGGVVGLWAATPSPAFEGVLVTGGFAHERMTVAVADSLDHTLYLVRAR